MLPDNDDLLNQLSCELGLSDFMDNVGQSILSDSRTNNIYDQFLTSSDNEEHNLFNELIYEDELPSSPESLSLKNEPYSPKSCQTGSSSSSSSGANSFPPSPSGSESSSDNSTQIFCPMDTSELFNPSTICHVDMSTPPVSPPLAIDFPSIINIGSLAGIHCITLDQTSSQQQQHQQKQQQQQQKHHLQQQHHKQQHQTVSQNVGSAASSVVNISNPNRNKVPIPKITKTVPAASIKSTPFVLTPQQLAQLTQSGIIKVAPAPTAAPNRVLASHPQGHPLQPIVIKSEPSVTSSPLTAGLPTVQSISPQTTYSVQTMISSSHGSADMKTLKRQQRMIKNRESACMSRKKKKEYVTNLEDQLNELSRQNNQLRVENEQLKVRLRELESEKTLWTDSVLNNSNVRKGTALFAILLLVSLNVGSLSNVYQDKVPFQQTPIDVSSPSLNRVVRETRHIGRTLLWKTSESDEAKTRAKESPMPNLSMCPLSVNQSESIRLDNQLRGWFRQNPGTTSNGTKIEDNEAPASTHQHHFRNEESAKNPLGNGNTALDHYTKPAVHSLTGSIYHMLITERDIRNPKFGKYGETKRTPEDGLTIYDSAKPRFTFESFFDAIGRREDTFYVVSFSGDHLLLPAASRNQSARPRMSLILPSILLPVNESMQALPNHVLMMQIDCEVINTGLVHIKEDAIPIHLSARMRAEAGQASEASAAASNSSLQRNDSQKPFRDFSNDVSGQAETTNVDKPKIEIRLDANDVENSIESSYQNDVLQKDDLRMIRRKFRQFSGTQYDRFSKFSPGRNRRTIHS